MIASLCGRTHFHAGRAADCSSKVRGFATTNKICEDSIMRTSTEGFPLPLPRAAFDLEDHVLWVMHCAEGPVPVAAAAATQRFLSRETRPWTLSWKKDFLAIPQRARAAAAALIGGREADISLVPTTSAGLVAVAQGYPWQSGDEVLLPLGEFPSNAWPWLALRQRGVTVREAPLWAGHRAGAAAWQSAPPSTTADPEQRLLASCGPRTRLLAVSWVRFQDGLRLDLRRLVAGCAERGIDLVVDGIQGAGTLPASEVPTHLDGLAAFSCGGHKGLLAPQGQGFLWTAAAFRQRLAPTGSWLSVEAAGNFARPSTDFDRAWLTTGERLEAGSPNLLSCVAFGAAMGLILEAGPRRIAQHLHGLQCQLLDGLAELPDWRLESKRLQGLLKARRLGSIIALHHCGHGAECFDRILQDGIRGGIYASVREGYLRIALHGWHRAPDVDRLLAWLAQSATHLQLPAVL